MENKEGDRMDWVKQAQAQADRIKETIRNFLSAGIEKEKALEIALENSCIGARYKAQIRYEVRGDNFLAEIRI